MRFFIAGIIGGALTVSGAVAGPIVWPEPAAIGSGYDSLLGESRGQCVNLDKGAPTPVSGEKVTYHLTQIQNTYALHSALNANGSVGYGPWSGSLKVATEQNINSFSSYMLVAVHVDRMTEGAFSATVPEPTLKNNNGILVAGGIVRFRQRCGDSYIAYRTVGGEFAALVEIESRSENEKKDIDAAASGVAGIFEAKGELKTRFDQSLSNHKINIRIIRGGSGGKLITKPDELVAAASNFPDELKNLEAKDLLPYRGAVASYATLSLPAGVDAEAFGDGNRGEYLSKAQRFIADLLEKRSDAIYVLSHRDEFPKFDDVALNKFVADGMDAVEAVGRGVDVCLKSYKDCRPFVQPAVLAVVIPKRIEGESRESLIASRNQLNERLEHVSTRFQKLWAQLGNPAAYCSPVPFQAYAGCLAGFNRLQGTCGGSGCSPD